jgi:hypothetical protein
MGREGGSYHQEYYRESFYHQGDDGREAFYHQGDEGRGGFYHQEYTPTGHSDLNHPLLDSPPISQ